MGPSTGDPPQPLAVQLGRAMRRPHSVVIEDRLWDAVAELAETRETSISRQINEAIRILLQMAEDQADSEEVRHEG